MNNKISKTQAKEIIDSFFLEIKDKTPRDVKKIKKLAMRFNIKLGERRKRFCKFCLTPYKNQQVRIKKDYKVVVCKNCGKRVKWKLV